MLRVFGFRVWGGMRRSGALAARRARGSGSHLVEVREGALEDATLETVGGDLRGGAGIGMAPSASRSSVSHSLRLAFRGEFLSPNPRPASRNKWTSGDAAPHLTQRPARSIDHGRNDAAMRHARPAVPASAESREAREPQ